MTDILNAVFRTLTPVTGHAETESAVPVSSTPHAALLVGEQHISRVTLLLTAVTATWQFGARVLFFTQTRIQEIPATLQNCLPNLCPEALKKIKFSYPKTLEELLQQVAGLHEDATQMSASLPSLIIVERLDTYLDSSCSVGSRSGSSGGYQLHDYSCAAHLSSLLCDTCAFLTRLQQQQQQQQQQTDYSMAGCRLIGSLLSNDDNSVPSARDPQIMEILDRYFQTRCTLHRAGDHQAGAAGAAVQGLWNVYFSGRGLTNGAVAPEWQMRLFPDGFVQCKLKDEEDDKKEECPLLTVNLGNV